MTNESTKVQNPRHNIAMAVLLALCALSCCFLCKVSSLVSDALLVAFNTHAFRGFDRQTRIFCFFLTSEHMLARFTHFQP